MDAGCGGQPVCGGKVHPQLAPQQHIGVGVEHLQRSGAVDLPQLGAQLCREAVLGEKLQQAAHTGFLDELRLNGPGLFGRDALEGGQLFRLEFQHLKGVLSEGIHQLFRHLLPDALDDAGGQIAVDGLNAGGQPELDGVRLELISKGGVGDPAPLQGEQLPRGHPGHNAYGGEVISPAGAAEDSVAVVLILKDHRLGGGLQCLLAGRLRQLRFLHLSSPFPWMVYLCLKLPRTIRQLHVWDNRIFR